MPSEAIEHLARLAWAHLLGAETQFCGDRIRRLLVPVVDAKIVDAWLTRVCLDGVESAERGAIESVQGTLDDSFRRQNGVYLTPQALADALAIAVEADPGEAVVDLSAGAGTLLTAVIRRHPHVRVVGVEKHPLLAVAAAINVVSQRLRAGQRDATQDRIFVGDGLARDSRWAHLEGRAAAVVGNPPYVREKGNRELFARLRREHDHLARFFGPRMDLLYLFFHRSASLVRPGGRLAMLTTAYWLSATNACRVREDMTQRVWPEVLVRVESSGVFSDAPGQHSLLSVFGRPDEAPEDLVALSLAEEPADWSALIQALLAGDCDLPEVREYPLDRLGAARWAPFADAATDSWARRLEQHGTPLSTLLADRQGFVSGADRFSARHPKRYAAGADIPDKGEPIFLFERQQIPDTLASLEPTVLRPVVRANQLEPNRIIVTPPDEEVALYLDGEVSAAAEELLDAHLGRFRPVLEHRREVRAGSMPWYRLHWPRDRAEQTGPKLVVPRRAPSPCFALDLSASAISSDCTYLVAPDGLADPLRYLVTLMVVLNSGLIERYLRNYGKSKGRQLEFYSEPLRTLPLPLRRTDDGLEIIDKLVAPATQTRWLEQVDALLDG